MHIGRYIIERQYKGFCNVIVKENVTDDATKITKQVQKLLYEKQPCKLSFQNTNDDQSNNADKSVGNAKLFISPDVIIPDGSQIVVTQNNRTQAYERSNTPLAYETHQEIELSLVERWR